MYKTSIKCVYSCTAVLIQGAKSKSVNEMCAWGLCRGLAAPFIDICCGVGLRNTLWAGMKYLRPHLFNLGNRKPGRILRLRKCFQDLKKESYYFY